MGLRYKALITIYNSCQTSLKDSSARGQLRTFPYSPTDRDKSQQLLGDKQRKHS